MSIMMLAFATVEAVRFVVEVLVTLLELTDVGLLKSIKFSKPYVLNCELLELRNFRLLLTNLLLKICNALLSETIDGHTQQVLERSLMVLIIFTLVRVRGKSHGFQRLNDLFTGLITQDD